MSGAGAAYQQLKRLDNTISDNANMAADRAAANMRQARGIKADRAKEEREVKRSDLAKLEKADGDFQQSMTDHPDVDSKMYDLSNKAEDKFYELAEEGRRVRDTDPQRFNQILDEQRKLTGSFKKVNQFMPAIAERTKKFQEMHDAGEISPVDEEYLGQMLALETNEWLVEYDDKNNMEVVFMVGDEEGNKVKSRVPFANIMNNSWRPYTKFQIEDEENKKGWVSNIASGMGLTKKTTPEGFIWTTTNETWGEKNEASLQAAIRGVTSDDRQMSSILYQATGAKKKTDFTEEDYEAAQNYLYTRVRGSISEETSKKFDSGAGSFLSAQGRLDFDKGRQGEGSNFFRPVEVTGEQKTKAMGGLPLDSEFNLLNANKPGEYIKGVISGDSSAVILSVGLKGGEVYARTRKDFKVNEKGENLADLDSKEVSETGVSSDVKLIKLSNDELSRIAPHLGVEGGDQVVEYLRLVKSGSLQGGTVR